MYISVRSIRARRPKMSRAEHAAATRAKLFDAAAAIVGAQGYASATIQEITRSAGVALGTFYNYFDFRQDLLDQLLPALSEEMHGHIRERVEKIEGEVKREEARFRAFFEFLQIRPEFYRILHEAEQFAPNGFRKHTLSTAAGYARALRRGQQRGSVMDCSEADLEVIAYMLMAARDYLSMRYSLTRGRVKALPEHVVATYMRLLGNGIFKSSSGK